jgi:macrolide transport system ATP-binding/permease protein
LVRRLGSDPARLLQSREPSPGETRKLMLAMQMQAEPVLLVLDEPTNHLDLPSVECLEEALDEFEGALILVSHDQRFLDRLASRRWRIELEAGGSCLKEDG